MDYDYITSKEGYRVEDLSEEHQKELRVPYWILEDLQNTDTKDILHYAGTFIEEEKTLDKIILETCEDFKSAIEDWLLSQIREYQISFGDEEGCESDEVM